MVKRIGLLALGAALLAACTQPAPSGVLGAQGAKVPSNAGGGQASVFLPNPVQVTGNQTLTDANDADAAVPASAYARVALSNLDGSGYLRGAYAVVRSETGDAAYSPTNTFTFTRHDDRFEQVMAYFWVTEAQKYLQSLGFGTGDLPPVNMRPQHVRINQWGQDNSFQTDTKDELRFGKGGVDDAEDGEVIVHEYGHAVHAAQVPGFGASPQAGAIGEAFGDYLAVSVGLAVAQQYGMPVRTSPACVGDWDSTSYSSAPHCLRRVDTNKTVADLVGEVHADGEVWSRALWDIRAALGAYRADRVIVNAQFAFAPDTTFVAAANATVTAAERLYGRASADLVRQAFRARGIAAQ
ncbi:M36 family metallopeptidase [Deinococcus maricopensis]|uniref:Peptidase M4 thermolysin n=1 Tax=Deinococcus maricopensis (strain DSM 21211 / LMG 22137 / NRRL B-23946 / LB-34) TaxID=709986 RepID=E8U7U1_DEIML|nr:M36 family metallopeptidase [Deinococcus maricopensis]ADV67130.1 peptidase M4 thermolysin [Deinococcus maricopensis DSM 21211]